MLDVQATKIKAQTRAIEVLQQRGGAMLADGEAVEAVEAATALGVATVAADAAAAANAAAPPPAEMLPPLPLMRLSMPTLSAKTPPRDVPLHRSDSPSPPPPQAEVIVLDDDY
mmetsp:Transcript_93186/g.279564  ORF Transcript_93186/g.279564 Transcript_93186/m.279564 type:complete len:113 (-) Transcript_93186:71-409(-)